MNNLMTSLKRFFQNKNTVTIIGVLLIVAVLIIGYRFQIKKVVTPVSGIPVAINTINPKTKITADMIKTVDVAPIVLSENVIRSKDSVIGKYTSVNSTIPAGSMFYTNTVVEKEEIPDSIYSDLQKDKVPYNFPVTMDTTYGNSIYPNSYIDIYMKAYNDNNELMVGKLIENIKVLAVKDSQGNNVFENSEESRTPAYLIFGLNNELNILLRKASFLTNYAIDLFPVPHGTVVTAQEGETMVSSQNLKDYINAHTVPNDELNVNKDEKKEDNKDTTKVDEKTTDNTNNTNNADNKNTTQKNS